MATGTGQLVHMERAGVVGMALPAAEAFPLFNAEGERRWVARWDPPPPPRTHPKLTTTLHIM